MKRTTVKTEVPQGGQYTTKLEKELAHINEELAKVAHRREAGERRRSLQAEADQISQKINLIQSAEQNAIGGGRDKSVRRTIAEATRLYRPYGITFSERKHPALDEIWIVAQKGERKHWERSLDDAICYVDEFMA